MTERDGGHEAPDFVLMRLVHAAEYVHARLDERADGFVPVKPARDSEPGTQSPGGRSSPHYSSPLPGRGEPTAGLDPPHSPPLRPTEPGPTEAQIMVLSEPGPTQAQIMVLQNLLQTDPETSASSAATDSPVDPGPWSPAAQNSDPNGAFSMWPPALLDQALRLGLLDPRTTPRLFVPEGSTCAAPSGPWEALKDQDVVLALARRLGQIGEEREAGNCSCHSSTAGRKPDDHLHTSDALLVLQGLSAEQGPSAEQGLSAEQGPTAELAVEAQGSERTLQTGPNQTGLNRAGLNQTRLNSTGLNRSLDRISARGPERGPERGSRSQPQSRAPTPKLSLPSGGRSLSPLMNLDSDKHSSRSRGKSRKGSLKVRLSKLFRTRSSGAGPGLDKRPSLASSTSSGGSLLDVWGSSSSTQDQDPTRLQVSRPLSAFSPVPFTPAFTDDFAGPPPQSSFLDRGDGGVSMQSLPPRSLVLPPAVSAMQHSLSLNDAFLRGLPRPIPLRPPRPAPRCPLSQSDATARCPLSQSDAGSFATSLRELEKCGWYWGPMTWEDAELKLKGKPDGSFLVRDSSDPRYILSLSFRSQSVTHHTRMEHYRGTFSLWCHPRFEDRCHSVVEFIERAIAHSKNGKFLYFLRSRVPGLPPTPVQLLYPVSRFSSVKTLQHLCRFCIRQTVRVDHIQELPLPTPLISYLRKFYYYDPEEEVTVKEHRAT